MDPQNKSHATPTDPASNDSQEVTVHFNETSAPGGPTPPNMPPTNAGPAVGVGSIGPTPPPVTPAGAAADGIPDASLDSSFPSPVPLQGPGMAPNEPNGFGAPAPGRPAFGGAPGVPGPQVPGNPGFQNQPMPQAPNPYPQPQPFGQQPNTQPFNPPAEKKPLDKKTFFILMGAALVLIAAIIALFFFK